MSKVLEVKKTKAELTKEVNDCSRVLLLMYEYNLLGSKGFNVQRKRLEALMREYLNE